jgi:acetyl esterase/lipase
MKKILILLFTLAAVLQTPAQETYPFVQRDSTLYLDVYRPAQPRADKACVMALFGGGFVSGSRDNNYQRTIAQLLTERGFTVVSIDYRLGLKDSAMVAQNSGLLRMQDLFQFCIDIAVEDCAAAVAWVSSHAGELNIDTSKIILTGSSAGAITVLQLDWCRANGLERVSTLPKGWKPAAVVPYAGAIMSDGKPTWNTPPAPTLLFHGTKDKIVAYSTFPPILSYAIYGAKTLFSQMRKQDFPCWIIRFQGIGHEVATWLPGSIDLFCAFVNQALAGRISTLDATMSDSKLVPTKWTDMTLKDLYAK